MNLEIEFVPGEKYRNRRGAYEVLELLPAGRMRVRYLEDSATAEFDQNQQSRIIANIQLEEKVQGQQAASAKPARPVARSASPSPNAPAKTSPAASPGNIAARPVPINTVRPAPRKASAQVETAVELPPAVPVRRSFEKLEVFRLLPFIGYGNLDAKIWFVGTNDTGPEDGNITLSERVAMPEFQKELADVEIFKKRYREESNYFYGNPAWRYANYLTTRLLEPDTRQTETARRSYYTDRFGSLDGEVLLTDTLPLPSRNLNSQEKWVYRNTALIDSPYYNDVLRDAQRFQEDLFLGRPTRLKRLSELYNTLKLEEKSPKYIFCYGRAGQWKYFREIFPFLTAFTDVELKVAPDKDRQLKVAVAKDSATGTLVMLLPGLSPQEGVTEFFLDHVVVIIKSMSR